MQFVVSSVVFVVVVVSVYYCSLPRRQHVTYRFQKSGHYLLAILKMGWNPSLDPVWLLSIVVRHWESTILLVNSAEGKVHRN